MANGGRRIPMIDKLTKQEEFPVWRDKLMRALRRQDLDKYITTTIPEPDNEEDKVQWRTDCVDLEDYLQAVVPGHKVWMILKGMGWNLDDMDPKKTFDKLIQYFEKGGADTDVKLLHEFTTIRREKFDRMEVYQLRVNYLRDRLDRTDFRMNEKAYTWLALRGIMKEYIDLYNRLVTNIQNDMLSWGDLMAEF